MSQDRYQQAKNVTLLGAAMNTFLGFLKIIGGYLLHSHGLIADGVHSFSDLFADCMVIFASKYGSLDADDTHPYGHQRIETAGTLMLSLLLILAGGGIAFDALYELMYGHATVPGFIALPIAFFSILVNELLFQYTRHVAKRIQSPLILTNAWHHRSDAAASLVVLIGLAGSFLGAVHLDAVAAVIVGGMIVKMGITYGWSSIRELVDTAATPDMLASIDDIIMSVPGVDKVHQLRTRFMGGNIVVDVHIQVAPFITVSEGHYIAQHVHRALLTRIDQIQDVTVHVDPEDDEKACPSFGCPNRHSLETTCLKPLRAEFSQIAFFSLHYIDGQITLDVIIKPEPVDKEQLQKALQQVLASESAIVTIRLLTLDKIFDRS